MFIFQFFNDKIHNYFKQNIAFLRFTLLHNSFMVILRKEMLNLDLQACFSNEMTEVTNDEAVFGVTFLIYAVKVVLRACCQWPAGLAQQEVHNVQMFVYT